MMPLQNKDATISLVPMTSSSHTLSKHDNLNSSVPSSIITEYQSSSDFNPTTYLQIQAAGKSVISCASPAKELETRIFSPATGRPVYISIRPSRRKGNCRLVRAEDELETAVARTTYRFGPGRNPMVKIGGDDDLDAEEFEMVGKSILNRTIGFETRRWGKFEWRYGSRRERAQYAADNLLILEKVVNSGGRVRVAQLVRNDALRTPGTKYMAAGNGGRLQMDLMSGKGYEVADEVVVVVTCLVMLKKEIDRLRAIQIAAMPGGAGWYL